MAKKEFNFEVAYEEYMKRAEKVGLSDDIVINTQMKEFKRLKAICDELYQGIEANGIAFIEPNSRGKDVYKPNPLVKEYVSAHKVLISTSSQIEKLLANFGTAKEDDWL